MGILMAHVLQHTDIPKYTCQASRTGFILFYENIREVKKKTWLMINSFNYGYIACIMTFFSLYV